MTLSSHFYASIVSFTIINSHTSYILERDVLLSFFEGFNCNLVPSILNKMRLTAEPQAFICSQLYNFPSISQDLRPLISYMNYTCCFKRNSWEGSFLITCRVKMYPRRAIYIGSIGSIGSIFLSGFG